MHLGLVIYGSLNTLTGGFIYDRNLVRHLESWGDQVQVMSLPWLPYALSLLDNFRGARSLQLPQQNFDLLLQDELVHPSFFWLNHRLRARAAYPIIAVVHHLRCREQRPAYRNRFYRVVERRYLAGVDGYICVSRTTAADVMDLVGNSRPLVVAYPGRDGLPGAITREEITARVGQEGPLHLMFVGNLIPRKGLHTLLTALAGLPRDEWRLTVAGRQDVDKAYVEAIRRQIKAAALAPQVTLLGALPPRELAARLKTGHLLAVPSSYEGFGIVYLEGMHFGLPAIAATAGAAREIIQHEHNGFLVDPEDAPALQTYIRRLMEDRDQLHSMSLAAHASAAAHHTWEESATLVRSFLQGFVNQRDRN